METVRNFNANASLKLKVGILLGALAFFAVAAFLIVPLFFSSKTEQIPVEVTDYAGAAVVPTNYKTDINRIIYKMLASVDELSEVSVEDAVVREGSYSEERSGSLVSARFIIDIESLHYSFEVDTSWIAGGDNTSDPTLYITCPHYLDVIYTDKKCIASSPEVQLERYLPHYERLSDDILYTAEFRTYDTFQANAGEKYLAVVVPTCSKTILGEAETNIKQWLKKIYLDPNDYYLEMIQECSR